MAHSFVVTEGDLPSAPTVLVIRTDNDEIILELAPPSYRTGDAAIQQMMTEWRAYASAATGGEPPAVENMTLFRYFLAATYSGSSYVVVKRY